MPQDTAIAMCPGHASTLAVTRARASARAPKTRNPPHAPPRARYGPWLDVNVLTPLAVDVTRITYWWWVEAGALGGADPPPPPPAGVGAGGDSSDPWPPPGLPPRMAPQEMGLELDGRGVGLGSRSKRYAAVIDDGVVRPPAAGGGFIAAQGPWLAARRDGQGRRAASAGFGTSRTSPPSCAANRQ